MANKHRHHLYPVWDQMRRRCNNPKAKQFADYGGRGIKVCERWQTSFQNFLADMGPRPEGMTIERIDNNGDYKPDNCRWATRKEQNENRRICIHCVLNGERMTLAEACRRKGIAYRPVVKRIQDRGWPVDLALRIPVSGSNKWRLEPILELWDENQRLKRQLQELEKLYRLPMAAE